MTKEEIKPKLDICKLKVGDTYVKGDSIYKIVSPFKPSKNNSKIYFGLSRYIGVIKNDFNSIEK